MRETKVWMEDWGRREKRREESTDKNTSTYSFVKNLKRFETIK